MIGIEIIVDAQPAIDRCGQQPGMLAGAIVVDRCGRLTSLLQPLRRFDVVGRMRAALQGVFLQTDLLQDSLHRFDVTRLA
jgi:hypothetical protein